LVAEIGLARILRVMKTKPQALDYTKMMPENVLRARIFKIVSIAAILLSFVPILLIVQFEILNYQAGSLLPLAPPAPGARHGWRQPARSESYWRARKYSATGDPTWATRALTPLERAEYERFLARARAEDSLYGASYSVCLIYPIVGTLLIGVPILLWKNRSRRWRIVLTIVLLAQIGAVGMIIYRDYLEVFGRAID
jgi:hypothetical protein